MPAWAWNSGGAERRICKILGAYVWLEFILCPRAKPASGDFSAVIGGERATPWLCRVSAMPYNTVWPGHQRPLEQTESASFLSFEMQEPVEVRLTANRPFAEAVVRPLNKGVQPRVSGREIAFTIAQPGAYTVELDGFHRALAPPSPIR